MLHFVNQPRDGFVVRRIQHADAGRVAEFRQRRNRAVGGAFVNQKLPAQQLFEVLALRRHKRLDGQRNAEAASMQHVDGVVECLEALFIDLKVTGEMLPLLADENVTQPEVAEGDNAVCEVRDGNVGEIASNLPHRFIEHRFNDVHVLLLQTVPQVLLGQVVMQNLHVARRTDSIFQLRQACRPVDESKAVVLRLQAELRLVFIVDRDVKRRRLVHLDGNAVGVDKVAFNRISPLMESEEKSSALKCSAGWK